MQKRFLVVDDDYDSLFVLKMMLARFAEDPIIHEFQNPLDAIVFFKENHADIDVVISDYEMPQMKGLEFIKTIHDFIYEDSNECLLLTKKVFLFTGYYEISELKFICNQSEEQVPVFFKSDYVTAVKSFCH